MTSAIRAEENRCEISNVTEPSSRESDRHCRPAEARLPAVCTLVTGSSGMVGRVVVERLRRAGHEVVPFDLDDDAGVGAGADGAGGVDIRCDHDIARRLDGVTHVVHLAAVLGWHGESADDHMAVNLLGTWRLLEAAVRSGVSRVVFVSSVDVLGVFKGERAPDYLPLDDDHPCYPSTPYATSKRLAEVLCADVQRTRGLETIVLRPPGVWIDETYLDVAARRADRPSYEWDPFWEYGAFLDVRDLAAAIQQALVVPYPGPRPYGLAADETNSSGRTSQEWAGFVHPNVPWRGDERFAHDPHTSLLDNRRVKADLDWTPEPRWRTP